MRKSTNCRLSQCTSKQILAVNLAPGADNVYFDPEFDDKSSCTRADQPDRRDPSRLARALPDPAGAHQLVSARPSGCRAVLERCRLRGRQTLLAGLIGRQAGAADCGAPAVPFPLVPLGARVMSTLRLEDLKQYSDTLR